MGSETPKLRILTIVSISAVVITGLFAAGTWTCEPSRVEIPPISQDKAPLITVHALAEPATAEDEETGQIEKREMNRKNYPAQPSNYVPDNCFVTPGAKLLLTFDGFNAGGVKSLSVRIADGSGNTLVDVKKIVTPDSTGKVPTSIQIIGHNGTGGTGPNPFFFRISNTGPEGVELWVYAKASNFHDMASTYNICYSRLGPIYVSFNADKYVVTKGQPVILSWVSANATLPLNITDVGDVGALGTATVWPTKPTTIYTLTATNFLYRDCEFEDKTKCSGSEIVKKTVKITVNSGTSPEPQPKTMGIFLNGQPMGPLGGVRPYVYQCMGTFRLTQIELPNAQINSWVAAIKLPKLGVLTDYCGPPLEDPSKYVFLPIGNHTTPQQMKEIYGAETPTLYPGSTIVACVSPRPGATIQDSVEIIITYYTD